jgi:uncharacterized membrane protein YkvA (DUF1232 family)
MPKTSTSSSLTEAAGFFGGLVKQARLAWRLWNDGRTPTWLKLIPVAALVYLLSPIDLVPDLMLPGLGELDDLAVVLLALKMFLDFSPPGVIKEHWEDLFGSLGQTYRDPASETAPGGQPGNGYIEANYRVLESEE